MGFDILNDSLRNKEAYKAIEKKEFFIAGPFELKQGGMAVVGRLPVFRKNKFWGFSAVIIKVSNLFKAAGIDGSGTSGYYFQLSKLNPNTHEVEYFLPLHPERNEANDVAINIHNAEWKLSATPVQLNIGYADIILLAAFGFLIALLGGYFVYRVVKSPELLNNLVNERTAQLKESEVKYRTIIEQASDGIILYSLDGTIHEFNNSAYLLSGNTKEEFQQLSLTDILFEKKVIINESKVKELNEGKSTIIYRKIKRKDGSHIEVEVNAKLLPDGKIIAIVRDITERLKAEAEIKNITVQLRELAGHLVQIREEERINIAREIHDDLGQQLTSLKMDIFWLNRKLNKEEVEIKQRTENALQLIDETIISVRRIATTLRPSIIDDLGLIAALEWQSSEFEKRSGIKVNFINNINDILLQPIVVTSLFRIYQELLTNVSRHAKANTINTVIGINSDQLYFSVSDDGIGFDMKTIINEKTLGLMGIKERSFFMEGHYEIITQPGKGTKVIITVPVQKAIQNN